MPLSPDLLIHALAVGAVSQTVATSKLFFRVRLWLRARTDFLGSLISCPWCFSHWVGILAIVSLRPTSHFIATYFALVMLANLAGYSWLYLYRRIEAL